MQLPHLSNPFLLQKALTHKSVEQNIGMNYERLEFLGDSFLGFIVDIVLVKNFSGHSTLIKKDTIVCNDKLRKWSRYYKLHNMINSQSEISEKSKVNADIFESYLGGLAETLFINNAVRMFDPKWQNILDFFTWLIKKDYMQVDANNTIYNKHVESHKVSLCVKSRRRIGHSVLNFAFTSLIYEYNSQLDEGRMTTLRKGFYSAKKYNKLLYSYPSEMRGGLEIKPTNKLNTARILEILVGYYMMNYENNNDFLMRWLNVRRWLACQYIEQLNTNVSNADVSLSGKSCHVG